MSRACFAASDVSNPHEIGRARRTERHAGYDDDALAGLGEILAVGDAAGAFDHVVLVVRVFVDDAMDTPHHLQLTPGALNR